MSEFGSCSVRLMTPKFSLVIDFVLKQKSALGCRERLEVNGRLAGSSRGSTRCLSRLVVFGYLEDCGIFKVPKNVIDTGQPD